MGRPGRAPGGWGAEDSGARAGPYPEATVICIAGYLGGRWAEIGHCCESLNEFVTLSLPGRKSRREFGDTSLSRQTNTLWLPTYYSREGGRPRISATGIAVKLQKTDPWKSCGGG